MNQDYFRFFTNCIVVKGYTRSMIADVQRQHAVFIPNSLAGIIERLNKCEAVSSLFMDYGKEHEETLQEYLDFLIEEDYGFYCTEEEFSRFPDLDTKFRSPCLISNIIIEIKKQDLSLLRSIAEQAAALGCKDVALVIYDPLDIKDFAVLRTVFDNTIVKSVEIISPYSEKVTEEFLRVFSKEFERLTSMVFHTAPEKRSISWNDQILCDVVFTCKEYRNFNFCGGIYMEYFNTNLPKVMESLNHNSCLHKKIAIDLEGNIKNCPSMPQSFGNIKDTTLEEALHYADFKKYWKLTKDEIAVCKDCEFRHICTDCRAYTERTHTNCDDLDTSRPLKCGYDPYTGEWEEWSTHPLKQKAIDHYGMQELIKNK